MYNAIKPITIEPRYLLIALLPVILFIAGEYLIFSGKVFPTVPHAGSFGSTQEATGRYVFYAAFLLFATMCLATVAVTSVDIGSLFDKAEGFGSSPSPPVSQRSFCSSAGPKPTTSKRELIGSQGKVSSTTFSGLHASLAANTQTRSRQFSPIFF